jgi:EAL domain-containing protein (putative c-di-GMP-specific phosphodiesterase class I)
MIAALASYLWHFPFDQIEIDRSLMQSFGGSETPRV